MKKNYTAPKLLLERFELKQRITESCGGSSGPGKGIGVPSTADKSSCGWQIGEGMILWPSAPACTLNRSVDEEINGICYHNVGSSSDGGGMFVS